MFGDVEVEIFIGVPPQENECNGVIHGVDVELVGDELIEGLKKGGVKVVGVKRLRDRGLPMETVMVTFRGKQVPEAMTFGYIRFRVNVSKVWARGGTVSVGCSVFNVLGRTQDHGR